VDEAHRGRREAEERADRLQMEANRLADELRREQENYKNAEAVRKSLEIEIREINVKLEEAESFAQREGKRLIAKLQARVTHTHTHTHTHNVLTSAETESRPRAIRKKSVTFGSVVADRLTDPQVCSLQ